MMGAERWRRRNDQDVLDAVSRFHEYTEVGQAILRGEMQRRGLSFPAAFASSCPNCGAPRAVDTALCDACGVAVRLARAGLADAAPVPMRHGVDPSVAQSLSTPNIPFFEVATQKFMVMSVCTFGAYSLYWFYENWKRISAANGRVDASRAVIALNALLRTFFAPFWAYAMFRDVRDAAHAAGVAVRWRPWVLATGYVVANLCYRLPNQAAVLSLVGVLCLLPVQQVMERVNRVRGGGADQNARYGAANIAGIILGVSLLMMVFLSPFLAAP